MHINHRKSYNKSSLLNQSKEPYIIILYAYSNDLIDIQIIQILCTANPLIDPLTVCFPLRHEMFDFIVHFIYLLIQFIHFTIIMIVGRIKA